MHGISTRWLECLQGFVLQSGCSGVIHQCSQDSEEKEDVKEEQCDEEVEEEDLEKKH